MGLLRYVRKPVLKTMAALFALCLVATACVADDAAKPALRGEESARPGYFPSAGPVPVPKCGAYWGAYVNARIRTGRDNAKFRLEALQSVEEDLGRKFDIDHQFYRWDNFLNDFSTKNHVTKSISDGRIQFLSWKPVYEDGTNIAWSAIAAGEHDELIREKAARVGALQAPVLIVFGHEANSRVGEFEAGVVPAGHITAKAGSEQDFVAAWRHIHDLFEVQGVTNVGWAWVMTRAPFAGDAAQADSMYPGEDYVDWVGLDPYNFYHQEKVWTEMKDQMVGFTNWIDTREVDKPWLLGEWGSVEDPGKTGRKAEWLISAADYFESEKRLKAVVHFDSSPAENWLYDSSETSRLRFIEISNRPYFEQVC